MFISPESEQFFNWVTDYFNNNLVTEVLTLDTFSRVPLHIPDMDSNPVKTELVINRMASGWVEKINWWHQADVTRKPGRAFPHNHPWDFQSLILFGGYTEERYPIVNGKWTGEIKTFVYTAGDTNRITKDEFHLVTKIEPKTVSRMVCGEARAWQEWGYWNLDTNRYEPSLQDPHYLQRLAENNRFLLKS